MGSLSPGWSSYKNTFKGLVGITPAGNISFVSKLYCGSILNRLLTIESGVVDLLEPGDAVMTDKGFTIQDVLAEKNIVLNIPPFRVGSQQFTAAETIVTR